MAINPKTAIIFFPGIIGYTDPLLAIFLAIISAPASPNPTAKSAPILRIVDSSILVSYVFSYYNYFHKFRSSLKSSYSATASSSAILAASRGFSPILLTVISILSIGNNTKSLESLIKKIEDIVSKNIKNVVLTMDNMAFSLLSLC